MSEADQNPDKMYDAANKLKEEGDLEGTIEALKKVVELFPQHLQSHLALGVHLQKTGRLEEAIAHAIRVTELSPEDAFSFTQLSVIYQRCGRIQEAEDAMAKARELQGGGHPH